MSTFYKYAERNVADRVDWSTISKNFIGMLDKEAELREQKKADIQKATTETLKSLSEVPTGLDKGANENILNFSAQGQDYLLMMNRLLKSGQLDPKDYSIYTQNLKSSTGKLFSAAKVYQENYTKNIERANAKGLKRASAEELWNRTQAENAANFSMSQYYIMQNGNVTVGSPTKDPATGQYVLNNDPNTYKNPEQLYYASSVDIDPFDVDGAVKGIVDTFGKNIIGQAKLEGRFEVSVEDITKRPGWKEVENNFIKGTLAGNSSNGASILTDWINSEEGKEYGYTSDPNDPKIKTGEKILMIADPANPTSGRMIPQLSPDQEKRAEEFMRQRLSAALDYELKTQYNAPPPPRAPTDAEMEEKRRQSDAKNLGIQLANILTGDGAASSSGGNYVTNIEGFGSIKKQGGILTIIRDDENGNPKVITNDIRGKTPEQVIRQVSSVFSRPLKVNEQDVIKSALGAAGPRVNTTSTFEYNVGTETKEKPLEKFNKYVDAYIGSTIKDTEEETVPLLRARFGKLGYKFEETGAGTDKVEITGPDKTKAIIDLSSPSAAAEIADFMKGNTDPVKIGLASGMGALGLPKTKKPNLAEKMKANKN